MQQLLPDIFEDKRAIPNCFLRGALFGMVRKGRRALVENQAIFTMSQYQVSFSGSEMDQNDLEVWDTDGSCQGLRGFVNMKMLAVI